jgi:hypothetical protein
MTPNPPSASNHPLPSKIQNSKFKIHNPSPWQIWRYFPEGKSHISSHASLIRARRLARALKQDCITASTRYIVRRAV